MKIEMITMNGIIKEVGENAGQKNAPTRFGEFNYKTYPYCWKLIIKMHPASCCTGTSL